MSIFNEGFEDRIYKLEKIIEAMANEVSWGPGSSAFTQSGEILVFQQSKTIDGNTIIRKNYYKTSGGENSHIKTEYDYIETTVDDEDYVNKKEDIKYPITLDEDWLPEYVFKDASGRELPRDLLLEILNQSKGSDK